MRGSGAIGEDIIVQFVIIAIQDAAGEIQIVRQTTIKPQLGDMRLQRRPVDTRDAEELAVITRNRSVRLTSGGRNRRHTTIGYAVVMDIFIRQAKFPVRAQLRREIGVQGVSFAADEIAMVVETFIDGVESHRETVGQAER